MRVEMRTAVWISVVILCFCLLASGQTKSTCLDCHSGLDQPFGIAQDQYSADVHALKGLTCASCHGGDPKSDDPEIAMGRAAGFKGHIDKKQVPELCGKCHSDGAYIRQYNPSLRTDQYAQYLTSQHGKRLAAGDTKVAVCTDCHSVHGIRPPSDTRSPVHPLNVAKTCSKCHADAAYMKQYNIPTDQYANYTQSVHYQAMTVRGDLSAPTCTTCHGNHGAMPPGVASVENVCSNCHVLQAQLFDKSPHKAAFATAGLPGCMTCHSNHKIEHPTDDFLGAGDKAVCVTCHEPNTVPLNTAVAMRKQIDTLNSAIMRSDEILNRADRSGMEISEAKLQESQAADALMKARVDVHSFTLANVDSEVQGGLKTAAATYDAGKKALAERAYRRKGLGISVILIVFVVAGLWMFIKEIERK
jgi:hypothetical protein